MIDCFAMKDHHKLPLYLCSVPDGKAIGVDAFSLTWEHHHLYMVPPTVLLTKVLQKVADEECLVVLIAPAWPKQS